MSINTSQNSFITSVRSKDKVLEREFLSYVTKYKNGNRVGEFAVGCLLGLQELIGNLLQDEKFPGVHIAFGHPYPEATGMKDWDAPTHVDVIPIKVSVSVDSGDLMKEGEFVVDLV